jgi:hypothetical protein
VCNQLRCLNLIIQLANNPSTHYYLLFESALHFWFYNLRITHNTQYALHWCIEYRSKLNSLPIFMHERGMHIKYVWLMLALRGFSVRSWTQFGSICPFINSHGRSVEKYGGSYQRTRVSNGGGGGCLTRHPLSWTTFKLPRLLRKRSGKVMKKFARFVGVYHLSCFS